MAKSSPARRNADGSVTRPTGQASPAKSSGGGRGFIPQGNKGAGGSGKSIRQTVPLHPVDRTASNKVQK